MKPQQQPAQDSAALEALGRASVQVVHDLKNQLNGLKLYATFLRKRAARDARPADEVETIEKIIAGLERAATDTNTLVRFGRAVELTARPGSDLAQILAAAVSDTSVPRGQVFRGDFDAQALTEAFQIIDAAVGKHGKESAPVKLTRAEGDGGRAALVEWETPQAARLHDAAASLSGSDGLRVALASKIVAAHGGRLEHAADSLRVRLPLTE
jgi:signal transduction histidine kinase